MLLDYFTRDMVRADLTNAALSNLYVRNGRPTNDEGWDIYPEGLYLFLKRFSAFGLPIYITENGMSDAAGDKRSDFLGRHMLAVERAVQEGVDVRGYFHWSLMDNFEWNSGYQPRFGLFTVDFANDSTLQRRPTPAVATFKTIAGNIPR